MLDFYPTRNPDYLPGTLTIRNPPYETHNLDWM